ncbi:MAG TPA: sulfotransferase [Thermohalobaculum sp.]|nr:sulfotransferase [Thermohalobaculum sp.]
MPRSGKTSIAQIVGHHPRIRAEPEVVGFSWIVERLIPDSADADFDADKIRKALFAAGTASSPEPGHPEEIGPDDADLVKISSNPANFWTLGLIEMMFPEARIIHCPRAPLPHCLVLFKMFFRDPRLGYANAINDIIEYFRIYNDLMAHWRQVLGIEIHEFPYDRLIARGEPGVKDLFAACGLDAAEVAAPLPRPAQGSIFDNGLFSAAPGAKAGAVIQEDLAMIEAYLRKIPELRQLLHAS